VKIGIAYSLAPLKSEPVDGPDDRYEEFDRPETVDAIAAVIRDDGHDVILLGDGREFLTKMLADPPDFVFNIAEGSGVSRNREARVPAVCEMLGVPYSGSDPLTLAATLDKDVAKQLVGPHELLEFLKAEHDMDWGVPFGASVSPDESRDGLWQLLAMGYLLEEDPRPMILKPLFEGSSKGIRGRCVAESVDEALDAFERLARDYHQPILIEEYIEGYEVTVGILGTGSKFQILGDLGIRPKQARERFVYSLEVKRDWQAQVDYHVPARLEPEVRERLHSAAQWAFQRLQCRDFARIDFRIRDGVPYFIEANPLPGLAPVTSDLVILAEGHGISHSELIRRILHTALRRVGLMEQAT
jgi:D-alanine-D-alanine ligase